MRPNVLFVLFVFLMSLFTSTFVSTLQESDENSDSDEATTLWSRQRRLRCPYIRDALNNGWVRIRNRGRIAKFTCNKGFDLIGNRIVTCIQGKWNYPVPVCATRGCQRRSLEPPYKVSEMLRGSVIEISCDTGFSFTGLNSRYRLYCNGSQWRQFGSEEDLSSVLSNQIQCKKSDTPETQSHLITSEEISTISPLKGAVTAKSETTTNSELNSKMPEMTAMYVSPVININAMSTESTSIFADKSKTPITEAIDKSYTSINVTNIIQEVSTLTTTTTTTALHSGSSESQFSWTQTKPKTEFTTVLEIFSNQTNIYSTKSPIFSTDNSTQFRETNATSSLEMTSRVPVSVSQPVLLSQTSSSMVSTPIPLKPTIPMSTTFTLSSNITDFNESFSPSVTSPSQLWSITTLDINSEQLMTSTSTETAKTFSDFMEKNSINITSLQPITTESYFMSYNKSFGSTNRSNQTLRPELNTSFAFNRFNSSKKSVENKSTTALNPNKEIYLKTTLKRLTTPSAKRQILTSKTTQSLTSSMNPMFYSLFAENTTIMPLRRRRQFSTKTRLQIISTDSGSNKTQTKRSLSISVTVISMTILVTILSLYLIKKRKNSQQNRLSDDSEMRYLSSNEVY